MLKSLSQRKPCPCHCFPEVLQKGFQPSQIHICCRKLHIIGLMPCSRGKEQLSIFNLKKTGWTVIYILLHYLSFLFPLQHSWKFSTFYYLKMIKSLLLSCRGCCARMFGCISASDPNGTVFSFVLIIDKLCMFSL